VVWEGPHHLLPLLSPPPSTSLSLSISSPPPSPPPPPLHSLTTPLHLPHLHLTPPYLFPPSLSSLFLPSPSPPPPFSCTSTCPSSSPFYHYSPLSLSTINSTPDPAPSTHPQSLHFSLPSSLPSPSPSHLSCLSLPILSLPCPFYFFPLPLLPPASTLFSFSFYPYLPNLFSSHFPSTLPPYSPLPPSTPPQ